MQFAIQPLGVRNVATAGGEWPVEKEGDRGVGEEIAGEMLGNVEARGAVAGAARFARDDPHDRLRGGRRERTSRVTVP